jgi:hypothetical protein
VEDAVADQSGYTDAAFRVLESTELGWDHLSVSGGQADLGVIKITPIATYETPSDTRERRATQCGQNEATPRGSGTGGHDLTVTPDPDIGQRRRFL